MILLRERVTLVSVGSTIILLAGMLGISKVADVDD